MGTMLRAQSGFTYSSSTNDNFEEEWSNAHRTVLDLINQRDVSKSEWHDLFRVVYNIHSWMERGSDYVRNELTRDISAYVTDALKRISLFIDDNDLLRVYIQEWEKYHAQTAYLPLPFRVLETNARPVVTSQHGQGRISNNNTPFKSIRELMLDTWRTEIFNPISDRLRNAALRWVECERNGETFDFRLVVGIRESYVVLNEGAEDALESYRKNFEKKFIEDTVTFYKKRASQVLEMNGVSEYMAYADVKLEEETNRATKYLHGSPESVNKLVASCTNVLVGDFLEQLLSECHSLVKKNDIIRLRQLYRLMKRMPTGMDTVVKVIDTHIKSEGLHDMRSNADTITSDPEKYVCQLLSLFEKFSALVENAFDNDSRLLTTRDQAFKEVVNDTSIFRLEMVPKGASRKSARMSVESKCPELLANYCDLLLRKTALSKRLTSEQIDQKLNSLLLVLKYVENKDVFMRYHKAHLSRRLVLDVSADQEKEEMMATRMRETGMPAEHVNKLFRMLQDIEVNKGFGNELKAYLQMNNSELADTVSVKVLNTGAWGRGGDRVRVSLPRELEDLIPPVETFYKKQHNGRKLNWMHHWSTGTVVFATRGGSFDLDVTTFQLALLFCWNECPTAKLSYESLRLSTELPDTELSRTLFSLCAFPKLRSQLILTDSSSPVNPKNFNDSTLFWINHDFKLVKNGREQGRGRLNLIGRLQLTMESSARTEHEEIVALRRLRTQEAIVKLMKMRKELTLPQLQSELVQLLKVMFVPTRSLIKETLEWLIENNYISRKAGSIDTFVYIA